GVLPEAAAANESLALLRAHDEEALAFQRDVERVAGLRQLAGTPVGLCLRRDGAVGEQRCEHPLASEPVRRCVREIVADDFLAPFPVAERLRARAESIGAHAILPSRAKRWRAPVRVGASSSSRCGLRRSGAATRCVVGRLVLITGGRIVTSRRCCTVVPAAMTAGATRRCVLDGAVSG